MANIKSKIKRIGTNLKAEERNKAVRSEMRTAIRAAREAISAGDKAKATESVKVASTKLDKAVSKGVIHKTRQLIRKALLQQSLQNSASFFTDCN